MWPFCKGMATGLIVGSALAVALTSKKHKPYKCIRLSAGKILKGAGSVIDTLQSFL